jgi:hypothetical protein
MSSLNALSGAEVKNEWRYTSAPLYAFMDWTGTALALFFTLVRTKSCHLYAAVNMETAK